MAKRRQAGLIEQQEEEYEGVTHRLTTPLDHAQLHTRSSSVIHISRRSGSPSRTRNDGLALAGAGVAVAGGGDDAAAGHPDYRWVGQAGRACDHRSVCKHRDYICIPAQACLLEGIKW